MKHLLTIIFLLVCTGIHADSADKRLHSFISEGEVVYFVMEKSLNKFEGDISKFLFDVTYPSSKDSVTVNFTIVSKNPSDVSAVTFSNEEKIVAATDVELLFHEIKGKKYTIRTTAKIAYADFKALMSSDHPLRIGIKQGDAVSHIATYSNSQWEKEKKVFSGIFYMINK